MQIRNSFLAVSLAALMGTLFIAGCDEDDDPGNNIKTYTAQMDGTQEVPANESTASGDVTATLNTETKILTLSITYTGMTATAAHIHKGDVGVSGDAVIPINTTLTSPISFTTVALTAQQEADLNAGLYYVNLHSVAYPDGEIRGQLED
jgi:hypothetical protein